MHEVELKLPSDPRLLKIVRSGALHVCDLCGFSAEEKNQVVLAVDEAASNIIKHTYRGERDKPIIVCYRVLDDRLEIILRDYGEKADLDKIKPRSLEDIRPGGLGVFFIKSTMDKVYYDNNQEVGNKLTLIKYLPGKKEST
ncbi:MAG: ATP-binding protein [bacterium]